MFKAPVVCLLFAWKLLKNVLSSLSIIVLKKVPFIFSPILRMKMGNISPS